MKRNVEARLAKLEANSSAGDGAPYFIFAENEEGETLEEFDKRVEGLVREEQRNGCASGFVFKLITTNGSPSNRLTHAGSALPSGPAS